MKKSKLFGELFTLSKTEKNGAIVLLVLIVLIIIFRFFIPQLFTDTKDYTAEIDKRIEELKIHQDSINNSKPYTSQTKSYKSETKSKTTDECLPEIEYFQFDPNSVSYNDLLKLGFSKKTANTLINYREKGGRFRVATDLLKLYGIDSVFYKKIEKYVVSSVPDTAEKVSPRDFEIKRIEINSADSALFTTLNGIGPVYASRICKYRKLLGGFYSINQLKEVYKFPIETFDQIKESLIVDTTFIKKININFAQISDLKTHPYCKFELARKMVDYRATSGSITSIDQLVKDGILTVEEFEKLNPYLGIE